MMKAIAIADPKRIFIRFIALTQNILIELGEQGGAWLTCLSENDECEWSDHGFK